MIVYVSVGRATIQTGEKIQDFGMAAYKFTTSDWRLLEIYRDVWWDVVTARSLKPW